LAIANILLQFCNATAFCDIPGWTIVGMFRVYRVWRGLSVDAVRIETEFEAMHDERKYWIQHVHNLHNDLDQECECADDRDDQIELGKMFAPDQWNNVFSTVDQIEDGLRRRAIEAIDVSIPPQLGPVRVWVCDTE